MTEPVLPSYGTATLADVLPSLGTLLGLPAEDAFGLPAVPRWVVLLVDGLGWDLLSEHADLAPSLASLQARGTKITSGVPSTTATSITSFGTGLVPGAHGMAGFTFRYGGAILNSLAWAPGVDGRDVQPGMTCFERLVRAGVQVATIAPAHFRGTGLTTAALRGGAFFGVDDENDVPRRVALAVQGVLSGPRSLTYVYERSLDHAGHEHGIASARWRDRLRWTDGLAAALADGLPSGTGLLITGDHGMVDVPREGCVVLEDEPDLMADLDLIGGEPRLRQLYTRPGTAGTVASRWRDRLGVAAWVRTRDEAVDEGWFGPMAGRLADRFGDVLVARADDGALLSRAAPKEWGLVGMHGSLTHAEMAVPLLVEARP